MSRLAVDIDPVAMIRNFFMDNIPDPTHAVVLAELGGAESIVSFFRDDMTSVNERDINIFREIVKSHLNVRCSIQGENIRKLLKIKPDMITFVSSEKTNTLEPDPVDLNSHSETLSNLNADLQANEITTSVLLTADINQVKLAGKIEFDFIEIFARDYALAEDLDHQLAELENINSLVLAANRLGMGANISGGINQENISELAQIPYLDDIIIGKPLTVKSLAVGYEQAVRDFLNLLNK